MADHACWVLIDDRPRPDDDLEPLKPWPTALLASCGCDGHPDHPINWSLATGGWKKVNLSPEGIRLYEYRRTPQPPCGPDCCATDEREVLRVVEVSLHA